MSIYPEHPWNKFRFPLLEFWNNRENAREFIEYLAKELNFKDKEDFYKLNGSKLLFI